MQRGQAIAGVRGMTRDDIIRMAFEAGAESDGEDPPFIYCDDMNPFKFADLVAAATREACAQEADAYATHSREALKIAAAIRAGGKP